jgi:allophanate hydrolase subunit 2
MACVIAADLPALGQLAPGDVVRLARVDRDEARRAHAACRAMFAMELRLP